MTQPQPRRASLPLLQLNGRQPRPLSSNIQQRIESRDCRINAGRTNGDEASRLRKITKPLMEKKRRERINSALENLKRFVAEPILKEGAQKLEKADILDLTVEYVHSSLTRTSQQAQLQPSYTSWVAFLAGYSACESIIRQSLSTPSPAHQNTSSATYVPALLRALETQKLPAAAAFLRAIEQQNSQSVHQTTPINRYPQPQPPPLPPRSPPPPASVWRPW